MTTNFRRRQMSWPMRVVAGIINDGLLASLVWTFNRFDKADLIFQAIRKLQRRKQAKARPFGQYQLSERDVIVAVYGKSGTNWTMQIAHQLLHHGKADFDHIHSVVAWPDATQYAHLRHYAIPIEDESPWRNSPEGKRVVKTHLNWEFLPYSEAARYICVIRDPKDVFVSNYFFCRNMLPMPSVETWLRLFLSDDFYLFGSWANNTAGYWAQRHRPNVLILSFLEMKRDLPQAVRRIAEFLNVQADDEILQEVCRKSSFDYMRSIDEKFEVWNIVPWRSKTRMMRKGVHGGSSELLSLEQRKEIDRYFTEELKRLGSDFPYEQFCEVSGQPSAQ